MKKNIKFLVILGLLTFGSVFYQKSSTLENSLRTTEVPLQKSVLKSSKKELHPKAISDYLISKNKSITISEESESLIESLKSEWVNLSTEELQDIKNKTDDEINRFELVLKLNSGDLKPSEMSSAQSLLAKKAAASILLIDRSIHEIDSNI